MGMLADCVLSVAYNEAVVLLTERWYKGKRMTQIERLIRLIIEKKIIKSYQLKAISVDEEFPQNVGD